ncbi:ABC-type nitrate/sulfonate/bicarbonate transport system ATPase subunit [Paenibacillus turicensis]|uniref:ABC-type nitrate/sulfonate/bicarbonate transport system ATPase subunit n=1 Tax=Paenibacillus turicensis TaxID=160487 RepID=A0ABS4FWD2_9BACL|nr:ABC transporter ATP-binding protein [Paenibacillus turicensis]MBP1906835.1 ABC-type nitrate/sulfonate/bicarbonate transport system ATPase subunit [Paenibacillus turicensis]
MNTINHSSSHSSQSSHSNAVPLLQINHVHKSFKQGKQKLHVLNDISLSVSVGEFVSIIGPSGCGKSTLFHLIGGLMPVDKGEIKLQGKTINGERGHISYIPQQSALFPWRNILDNLLLAQEIAGTTGPNSKQEALDWLDKAGMAGFEKAYPHMLSGGMQQRVSFLRGMLAPQEIMCLDEPFSSLDALTRADMQRWLLDIWESHQRSVLMITHSIDEALMLSDKIYLLSNRPASVLQVIDVPFGRPRQEELETNPLFLQLKQEISHWMRQEQQQIKN